MSTRIDSTDARLRTLWGAGTIFFSQPEPRLLATIAAAAWINRIRYGAWRRADYGILLAMIGVFQPLQEALAHRWVLHAEPTTLGPWHLNAGDSRLTFGPFTIDVGKFHRDHHLHPDRLDGFAPLGALISLPPLAYGLSRVCFKNPARAATAFALWSSLALWYEWVHFAVHSPYHPKTRLGKFLREKHLRHHYQNEQFWWVVSVPSILDDVIKWWRLGVGRPLSVRTLFDAVTSGRHGIPHIPDRNVMRSPTVKTVL